MFHELRIYRAEAGKLKAITDRFKIAAKEYFPKHGVKLVHGWTVHIGENNHDFHYLVEWESMEAREAAWNSMAGDTAWAKVKADSEKDGPLMTFAKVTILKQVV